MSASLKCMQIYFVAIKAPGVREAAPSPRATDCQRGREQSASHSREGEGESHGWFSWSFAG